MQTSGRQPMYITNHLAGWPILRFDGSDSLLLNWPVSPQTFTIFVVGKNSKASGFSMILGPSGTVGNNQIRWEDGQKHIDYTLSDQDFPAMKSAFKAAAKIYLAAGADRVFLPTCDRRVIESEDQIDAVVDGIENNPFALRMVSYHPQGTMRMGADAKHSVVNPMGESHYVKGLFVADASLFPTSIIVNPQQTVYAMSHYISDHVLEDKAGYFS